MHTDTGSNGDLNNGTGRALAGPITLCKYMHVQAYVL